jgi:hypothetical protein
MQEIIIWFVILLSGLSNAEATLQSLEQVDDHPLYTMTYYGSYEEAIDYAEFAALPATAETELTWGCSLFTTLADSENALYGRNFDWRFSPALLLFTNPPDGYASVSMVDIEYLGFGGNASYSLTEQPIEELTRLLSAPYLPFDGMNEHGLVIGMAAVPDGNMEYDPDKETIDSLMVMRYILDNARTVDAAVEIIEQYNIEWGNGPPLHYLIADATGQSVLVEFYDGQMYVIPNEFDWQMATNFLLAPGGNVSYRRYDIIETEFDETNGLITMEEAVALLDAVHQSTTQWSIVYGINSGEVNVVMNGEYDNVHTFQLDLVEE